MDWLSAILITWMLISFAVLALYIAAFKVGARADRRSYSDDETGYDSAPYSTQMSAAA